MGSYLYQNLKGSTLPFHFFPWSMSPPVPIRPGWESCLGYCALKPSLKAKRDAGTKQWKAGKLLAAFHTTGKISFSFSKLWHLCKHLMPVRTLLKSVLSLSAEEHGGFCAGRTVSLLFPAQIGGHQKTHGSLSATFLQYKACPGEL